MAFDEPAPKANIARLTKASLAPKAKFTPISAAKDA